MADPPAGFPVYRVTEATLRSARKKGNETDSELIPNPS